MAACRFASSWPAWCREQVETVAFFSQLVGFLVPSFHVNMNNAGKWYCSTFFMSLNKAHDMLSLPFVSFKLTTVQCYHVVSRLT